MSNEQVVGAGVVGASLCSDRLESSAHSWHLGELAPRTRSWQVESILTFLPTDPQANGFPSEGKRIKVVEIGIFVKKTRDR